MPERKIICQALWERVERIDKEIDIVERAHGSLAGETGPMEFDGQPPGERPTLDIVTEKPCKGTRNAVGILGKKEWQQRQGHEVSSHMGS